MTRKKQTILLLAAIRQSTHSSTAWLDCMAWARERVRGR